MNDIYKKSSSIYYTRKYAPQCKNINKYCYSMRISKDMFVPYCWCDLFKGIQVKPKPVLATIDEQIGNKLTTLTQLN